MAGIFQRLCDWLSATADSLPAYPRLLFIDDDVVGDIEVLPASTAGWCAEQMARIAEFAAAHEAPGGTGWNDVYVRPPPPAEVEGLALWFDDTAAALAEKLPEIRQIVTGSLTSPEVIHRARGFGPSGLTAVVIYRAPDDPRRVQIIELSLRGPAAEVTAVLLGLAAVPAPEPLIVVNWRRGRMLNLSQPAEIAGFTAES